MCEKVFKNYFQKKILKFIDLPKLTRLKINILYNQTLNKH